LSAGGEGDDDEDGELDASAAVTADAILRDCKYNLHVNLMASNRGLKARPCMILLFT